MHYFADVYNLPIFLKKEWPVKCSNMGSAIL